MSRQADPEDEQKLLNVMSDLQESTQYYLNYIVFSAMNVLVCFLRFFWRPIWAP